MPGATDGALVFTTHTTPRGPANSDDWHTAPGRQYLVTLQGTVEIEIGDGKKVTADHVERLVDRDVAAVLHDRQLEARRWPDLQ